MFKINMEIDTIFVLSFTRMEREFDQREGEYLSPHKEELSFISKEEAISHYNLLRTKNQSIGGEVYKNFKLIEMIEHSLDLPPDYEKNKKDFQYKQEERLRNAKQRHQNHLKD